jgi:hypothetical protein
MESRRDPKIQHKHMYHCIVHKCLINEVYEGSGRGCRKWSKLRSESVSFCGRNAKDPE